MAGSTITYPLNGAANWEAFPDMVQKIQLGFMRLALTEMDTEDEPAIAAGSVLDVNGTVVVFSSEESISGWSGINDFTDAYIKIVVSGSSATAEFTDTPPTWSDSKHGWYDGNDRYVGKIFKEVATVYANKYVYPQQYHGTEFSYELLQKADAEDLRRYADLAYSRSFAVTCIMNWSSGYFIENWYPQSVHYIPELKLFIGVGSSSNQDFIWSESGKPGAWSYGSGSPTNSTWCDVAYSPSLAKAIAVGTPAGTTGGWANSTDGKAFTSHNVSDMDFKGICWSEELTLFVAIASGGGAANRLMRSSDGSNWTEYGGTGIQGQHIMWIRELRLFLICGNDGTNACFWTSPDGINWTKRTYSETGFQPYEAAYDPKTGIIVAVGYNNTNQDRTVHYSYDAINWNYVSMELVGGYAYSQTVVFAREPGVFVLACANATNHYLYWSFDGLNWRRDVRQASVNAYRDMCYSEELNRFVMGSSSDICVTTL